MIIYVPISMVFSNNNARFSNTVPKIFIIYFFTGKILPVLCSVVLRMLYCVKFTKIKVNFKCVHLINEKQLQSQSRIKCLRNTGFFRSWLSSSCVFKQIIWMIQKLTQNTVTCRHLLAHQCNLQKVSPGVALISVTTVVLHWANQT